MGSQRLYVFSVSNFFFIMRFQRWSVLFRYEFTMMVGFVPSRVFRDSLLNSVTRFQ